MLDAWDGHFVAGGPSEWRFGAFKADPWLLQDWWVGEVLRITFEDEFRVAGMTWEDQPTVILYNVLLRALAGQTFTTGSRTRRARATSRWAPRRSSSGHSTT